MASAGSDQPLAARLFAAWLEAFDAADRDALVVWHEKNFPYAAGGTPGVDQELLLQQTTGGFDLKKTEESTATRFAALVKEKDSDQFARATIELDAVDPHRVTRFELSEIPTPDEFRPKRVSEREVVAALRAELEKAVARDRFSGAVLIAKNGAPVFAQACGLADRDKKLLNKLDTQFRIGSMNKMFTATAVLQLVQDGKLAVSDPLGKIVRDYPNKAVASKVTIHHLLTHTGGTGDIFGPEFDAHRLELRTLDDYVKLYGERELTFEPGATWDYSNYGYLLLGVVIQRATGKSYYDWVNDNVFARAGMTATASLPEDRVVPDRARGYMRPDPKGTWAPSDETLPYRGTSAGGGYSTVNDLLRFANALMRHELLDAKHTDLLTTAKTEIPGGGKYGYGFGEHSSDAVRCIGHNGGAPGMSGDLLICGSGYTIAVLSNLDPPAAFHISALIRNRLPAEATPSGSPTDPGAARRGTP